MATPNNSNPIDVLNPVNIDPELTGIEDCDSLVSEGADPGELRDAREEADSALINAMGRRWVIVAAGGDPDDSDAWESIGLPWCDRYAKSFRARATELAAEVQS